MVTHMSGTHAQLAHVGCGVDMSAHALVQAQTLFVCARAQVCIFMCVHITDCKRVYASTVAHTRAAGYDQITALTWVFPAASVYVRENGESKCIYTKVLRVLVAIRHRHRLLLHHQHKV